MKILILGSANKSALEVIYCKYLNELPDIFCAILRSSDLLQVKIQKTYLNRIFNRFEFSFFYTDINIQIKESILSFKPDIVLVFKGMELLPVTLEWIKSHKIILWNFNPDNPFLFSGRGSGNKNVKKSIGIYDKHLSYDWKVINLIKKEYNIQCDYLPFGFDDEAILESELNEVKEINEVCFLGNPDYYRVTIIKESLDKGLAINVYGHGWNKYLKHPNLKIHDAVYGKEFYKTLRAYRVQLNIMREHNLDSHNMRSFEIPGVGGIMLAPKTSDHEKFFNVNQSIFTYDSVNDLVSKAKVILRKSNKEAEFIRTNAKMEVLEKGYTYKKYAQKLIK